MNTFSISKDTYGKQQFPIEEYDFFLHADLGGIADITHKYFFLEKKSILEFVLYEYSNEELLSSWIIGRFHIENKSNKTSLLGYLKQWIIETKLYYGLNYEFVSSPYFTEKEFKNMIDEISNWILSSKNQFNKLHNDSPYLKLCEKYNMEIFVSDLSTGIIQSPCPTSTSHLFFINVKDDSWWCGYCDIKGNYNELVNYIESPKSRFRKIQETLATKDLELDREILVAKLKSIKLKNSDKEIMAVSQFINSFQLENILIPFDTAKEIVCNIVLYVLNNSNHFYGISPYIMESDSQEFLVLKGSIDQIEIKKFKLVNNLPELVEVYS
mgnify:CR=1 FL=1